MKRQPYLNFGLLLITVTLFACGPAETATDNSTALLMFKSKDYPPISPGETYKSKVFTLTDKPARIVYEYASDAPEIGGVFAVFIVPEGKSSAEGAGMPQIITNASNEKSTQPIEFAPPGRYFLEVSATGTWTLEVQQNQ